MHNPLGTGLVIAVLAGGFAITGDLGWLLGRGLRVIEATDVPDDEAPVPVVNPPRTDLQPPPPAPIRRDVGPASIDLAALRPGQRILVRLDPSADPLPVDVIDPATAAVILHRGPPRRATIAGGVIVRGEPLRVITLGLAHAGSAASESLGEVAGISVTPDGRR